MKNKIFLAIIVIIFLASAGFSFPEIYQTNTDEKAPESTMSESLDQNLKKIKVALKSVEQRVGFKESANKNGSEVKKSTPTKNEQNFSEKIKITVLNGSEVNGTANRFKELLEKTISSEQAEITAGNTESTEVTIFKTKASLPRETESAIYQLLKTDSGEIIETELSEESASDVIITLGKNFRE